MNDVVFIEKAKRADHTDPDNWCVITPILIRRGDKEAFAFNQVESKDENNLRELKRLKAQLLSNSGAYIKFSGKYGNPIKFLRSVTKNHQHIVSSGEHFVTIEKYGFTDFHGYISETMASFHYRIYDEALLNKTKDVMRLIDIEDWRGAFVLMK